MTCSTACTIFRWEELLPADAAFPVTGSSLNSQLSSVPACQSIIKKAVVKRLMAKHHTSVLPETGAEYKIRFMLRKDQCEIMLDTTGDGLHKRGYRRNAMEAPIRETLAATIADLGRVRRDSLVEDPFCGSGTLLIEAAQKAMNIAPGLKRRFAAERYGFVPAAIWAEQRQKALAEAKLDVGFEAFGYDIDPAAVALANANAKLAGVEKRCHFEVADVADFAAKQEAIVLTNPPYGERMSTIEGAAKLARTLGRQMEAHPCAGVYAITADMDFETHYGKRANKRRKMYNGMIPCQLYMYYSAPKFEHHSQSRCRSPALTASALHRTALTRVIEKCYLPHRSCPVRLFTLQQVITGKKTKRGLNWQEMEMNANTGSFMLCSVPCAAKMRQIHALFTKDG